MFNKALAQHLCVELPCGEEVPWCLREAGLNKFNKGAKKRADSYINSCYLASRMVRFMLSPVVICNYL